MDRYVKREPRVGLDYPQGNPMTPYSMNITRNNNMIPQEGVWYGPYNTGSPYVQPVGNTGFMGVAHHTNTPSFVPTQLRLDQAQVISGIDPTYLATFASDNSTYIATGQQIQREPTLASANSLGSNYQNRNFVGVDINKKTFLPQRGHVESPREENEWKTKAPVESNNDDLKIVAKPQRYQNKPTIAAVKTPPQVDSKKSELQNVTRSDRLKALHKSGPRAFSGPVEKVLKWHKTLQNIGVLVFYEVIAKCVNIRSSERCAKNLVIRDDNGPAIQVIYYEIDFFLAELKPPCMVRVIGRMMSGTCRLQAFSVRLATGDDLAALPRRAAVATHHVTKLCNEYGLKLDKI